MNEHGHKADAGKVDPSYVMEYFPRALLAVSRVSEFGAKKYVRDGWRTVPNGFERYTSALDRHRLNESIEGRYDITDSKLLHAAQVAWNALARLEILIQAGVKVCENDAPGGSPSPDLSMGEASKETVFQRKKREKKVY